ncbi:MAG: hypothetical protein HXX08_11415 [Chloroflexi bacterium]|uniref:Uncharacterized protein n=1 Tax=Candidatus Chlorohelix allophototropha TaxID=3003348 RepID=A0A8T7LWV6_9CHLR|nr:hypothetical protein [Chloroflexota bacterium]WJW65846.1 hypothetical protein OZ401_001625 [Chloroflexota bacterium L227-S17]
MNYRKNSIVTLQNFPGDETPGENWVKLQKPTGEHMLQFLDLNGAVKEVNGVEMQLSQTDAMLMIIPSCILGWSFTDYETGQIYPATYENIKGLEASDFNYLIAEFGNLLNTAKKLEPAAIGTPRTDLTATEKNSSLPLSSNESGQSETSDSSLPTIPERPSEDGKSPEFGIPVTEESNATVAGG